MRISDWSSDVCSSDLIQDDLGISDGQRGLLGGLYFALFYCILAVPVAWLADRSNRVRVLTIACALWSAATIACGLAHTYRSEEHTSELQSLMRISYAVFCLKKK